MLCGRIVIDMKTYSLLDVYKLNRKILGVMMPIAATVFLLLAIIILIAMPTIWWGSLILFGIALGLILLCIFIRKYIDKKIKDFSKGMKMKLSIAVAFSHNSKLLILDEATSASDPENQMEIDKAIQNLCKGKTVIVVAHRLSALKMCERVAVVENHTITCVGTHEEVRKNNAYYRKAWEDYETARNITYQLEGGEQHE